MQSNLNELQDGHPTGSTLMAALDRELPAQQNSAVENHVKHCSQCAAQWERLRQVSGRLTEYHLSVSSVPGFELHLPSNDKRTSAIGGIVSLLRRPQFFAPTAALAAALLGLMLWMNPRTNVARVQSAAPPADREMAESGAVPASKPAIPVAQQKLTAKIQTPRRSRSAGPSTAPPLEAELPGHASNAKLNAAPPQIAEVFWYLPYSDPALAAEGAEVVHADLPREAFLMAGVPLANIPAAGPKDRIAADIVIGVDGLPRAIRPARQQTTATVIPTQL